MRLRPPPSSSSIANCKSKIANAFTLIELLVVIGIIVIIVALAIPVLNVLQGNRSSDAAQNQLQALVNEARMIAIGLQRDAGVFFYIDPSTKRINTVLVQGTDSQPGDLPAAEIYLDLVHDHESVPLTLGLSLQVIDNATVPPVGGGPRSDDGYIGYNTDNPAGASTISYGGVILFDSHGQLVSRSYGFRLGYPGATAGAANWSDMGKLIMLNSSGNPPALCFLPGQTIGGAQTPTPPPSQSAFGLVVFSAEAFRSQDFTDSDAQVSGSGFANSSGAIGSSLPSYLGPEQTEEDWIDKNSIPLIVNRYNGTLIRGE
jgi:prepilin-type N-terminal cleavage/methylation domain-containing protein